MLAIRLAKLDCLFGQMMQKEESFGFRLLGRVRRRAMFIKTITSLSGFDTIEKNKLQREISWLIKL